ncbi:hypothetical protein [Pontibacter harenae]|uniref:hypothetical protein n=1 Tax=Pontibacter harenae TaxID=2894083 RepID=UPI001E335735|nr:hypothetical protein [Pontibacter harenae]MCC9165817.1 hypothetical protein [Pontibacter harenae]
MKALLELKANLHDVVALCKDNLSGWYVLLALFLFSIILTSCEVEEVNPMLSTDATKQVVIGRWSIEKVDYELCKNRVCNTTNYRGSTTDYFEFRADSAELVKANLTTNRIAVERFKVEYTRPGVFVLSNTAWSGRFEILESKFNKLILKCSFTGRDPGAVFTDTYYLFQ